MDALSQEAIVGLEGAVRSLLAPASPPGEEPVVRVQPRRITPTGVGGLVGVHEEPRGTLFGRRIEATVLVRLPDEEADDAIAALLAAGRRELARAGILRIELMAPGESTPSSPADERQLAFDVRYEFLKLPESPEGIIEEIPAGLHLSPTGRPPRKLFAAGFTSQSLARFEVVDDPQAGATASTWSFDAQRGWVVQGSVVGSGDATTDPTKPGTALVLRDPRGPGSPRDLVLSAVQRSGSAGGMGLVFRWQDAQNFYFFLMHRDPPLRILAKKVGGTFAHLTPLAVDSQAGFAADVAQEVRLTVVGERFEVAVDGDSPLAGADADLPFSGRVGLLSWRNDDTAIERMELLAV